jgi:hypothetical protein
MDAEIADGEPLDAAIGSGELPDAAIDSGEPPDAAPDNGEPAAASGTFESPEATIGIVEPLDMVAGNAEPPPEHPLAKRANRPAPTLARATEERYTTASRQLMAPENMGVHHDIDSYRPDGIKIAVQVGFCDPQRLP